MKKFIAASIAAMTIAGAAQAQDMFAFMGNQEEGTGTIIIEPLSASGDGYIAIFDYHKDVVGDLLGVASVNEGANSETRVQVGRPLHRDVIAYLFIGDEFMDPSLAVDSVEIDIE